MKLSYRPELDGLRAVAVLAVMGWHSMGPTFRSGYIGVDVFFVLSGYLITTILAAEFAGTGAIQYRAFLLRRARRLVPALLVMVAAVYLLTPLLWPTITYRRGFDALTALTYTTNLRQTVNSFTVPLSHTWSLAAEEQFYLLWPLVLPPILRLDRERAAKVLLTLWLAMTAARIVCQAPLGENVVYHFPLFHSSGLLLGAALALRPISTRFGGAALLGLIPLAFLGRGELTHPQITPIAEILTALVISNPPKLLAAGPAVFLGKISYSLYLWNLPVQLAPHHRGGVISTVALTFVLAVASHFGVERWYVRRGEPRSAPETSYQKSVRNTKPAALGEATRVSRTTPPIRR